MPNEYLANEHLDFWLREMGHFNPQNPFGIPTVAASMPININILKVGVVK
jgi:hypothetical protein